MDLWYSGIGGAMQHISDTLQSQFMAKQMKPELKIKSESLFYKRLLNPDYKLDDQDPLPFFSDWKALSAAGHTFHNIMLYNEKNRLLYIADTMIHSRGKFLPPGSGFAERTAEPLVHRQRQHLPVLRCSAVLGGIPFHHVEQHRYAAHRLDGG